MKKATGTHKDRQNDPEWIKKPAGLFIIRDHYDLLSRTLLLPNGLELTCPAEAGTAYAIQQVEFALELLLD